MSLCRLFLVLFFLTVCGFFKNIWAFEIQNEFDFMQSENCAEVCIYQGEKTKPLFPILNEWIVSRYIEFPFLYVAQEETPPTHLLAENPDAFVLFAEEKDKKVGMLIASPLDASFLLDVKYSPLSKLEEIEEKGFDPKKILYVHGFLVAHEKRGDFELINRIYQTAVHLAKEMGKTHICYFTTLREENHPLKPSPYIPLEPFEDLPTPFESMDITFKLTWPTLQADGSVISCENLQALFIQKL